MKYLLLLPLMLLHFTINAQIGKKVNPGAAPGLEGTWTCNTGGSTLTLVLYSNGGGEFDGSAITYKTAGGKLTITSGNSNTVYNYQLNGSSLKLSGGDLDKPVTFTKPGGEAPAPAATPSTGGGGTGGLMGAWVSNDIELDFKPGGDVMFNGNPFKYSITKNELLIYNPAVTTGKIYFTWSLANNRLTLSMKGGETNVFERKEGGGLQPAGDGGGGNLLGVWAGQGIEFNFTDGRNLLFNGKKYTYTAVNGTLTCSGKDGSISYGYEINAGHLMLNYNGTTLMLAKKSGGAATPAGGYNSQPATGKSGLVDTWVGPGGETTLLKNGTAIINGATAYYTVSGNTITFQNNGGMLSMNYSLNGDKLTVHQNTGTETYYRKGSAAARQMGGAGGAAAGGIDRTMVGKWVRMGGGTSGGGSYSYEEYFVLYANGTYEYYSESGRNVSGNNQYGNEVFNGGTASQGADRGTWSVRGNVIYAQSQTKGMQQYPFVKRNNKNGDPCIVLDGTEYVTATQRSPW